MPYRPTLLFIAPSAYPLGGVQTWLDYLLPGLEEKGFQTVLALTSGQHHRVNAYLATHHFDNVETIDSITGTTQGRVEALERVILKVKPTITVNVNIVDVYQAVNNLRLRGLSDTHLVTSIHGIQADLFSGIHGNASVIDAVVSTNRLTQKLINNATNILPENSFYAPYGVAEGTNEHRTESRKFTVVYAGRIEESQKRINDLLKIFSRLLSEMKNIHLVIAGAGKDTPVLEQWLNKEVNNASNIDYLGVIRPEDVNAQIYAKADAFILTSEWETGPIVAWEAMNNGVCFISSRYIGSTEENSLLDGENCLLFDRGDIDSAVHKIKMAQDPLLRKKLIRQGKQLVRDKYSHEKSIETWANCFKSIFKLHSNIRR